MFQAPRWAAITGYGRAEDRNAEREAGFDIHLVKPAELTELEEHGSQSPQRLATN